MTKKDSLGLDTLAKRVDHLIAFFCNNLAADFARRTGIKPNYVAMLRSGERRNLGAEKLQAISRAFSVNVHWVETGEGDMMAPAGETPALHETFLHGEPLDRLQSMFGWWLRTATNDELHKRMKAAVDDPRLPEQNRTKTVRIIADEIDRRAAISSKRDGDGEAARAAFERVDPEKIK